MSNESPQKSYTSLSITNTPGSTIEIVAEVPADIALVYRHKALEKLRALLELPGFRKGHVPPAMAEKHIGEQHLWEEAAELAISRAYAEIVIDNTLDVLGRPQVTVTKLAPGNPIGFKIMTAVYPSVTLPDYRALATAEIKKHDDPEAIVVEDAEVDGELGRLQNMFAEMTKQADADTSDEKTDKNPELPEINDDFARMLGDFADLADLKEKLKGRLLVEKKTKAYEKRRLAMIDRILEKTTVEVPAVFVEGELDQMLRGFEERVERAGLTLEGYLKQINKTLEALRAEWNEDATKRAKLQIVLAEIAKKDGLKPEQEKVDREVAHVLEHYPDAAEEHVRTYVYSQMTNEQVFASLEGREPVHEEHDHDHGHEGHKHE